jgi:hypothetical protein
MRVLIFASLLPIIIFAHGALASELVGQGPITISPYVEEGYEKFKRQDERLYFAVSSDGRAYGITICRGMRRCVGATRQYQIKLKTISACAKSFEAAKCFIFADKQGVVWEGEVRYSSGSGY